MLTALNGSTTTFDRVLGVGVSPQERFVNFAVGVLELSFLIGACRILVVSGSHIHFSCSCVV